MSAIKLHNVSYRYPGGASPLTLRAVDLSVPKGEVLAIVGPSGAGKSTLLKLIADLLPKQSGQIEVADKSPAEARAAAQFGYIFQTPTLLPWRSVRRNVALPFQLVAKPVDEVRVSACLELVGLSGFQDHLPHQLSGGMQQLVAIARALVLDPPILLMDEPFASLDMVTRERLGVKLAEILESTEKTVIFVTHQVEEAVFLADRVVVMTPRPGSVFRELGVDLPKPRAASLRESDGYYQAVRQVRGVLSAAMHDWIGAQIVSGEGRGRVLGFPTLNLDLNTLPFEHGVYAAWVRFEGKEIPAVLHYGPKSTFGGKADTVEIFCLEETITLPSARLEFRLGAFIRGTMKFDSKETLIEQMQKDVARAERASFK